MGIRQKIGRTFGKREVNMDDVRAMEIIQELADGVDPFTGEVFSADSPYQNVEIIRALHNAVEVLRKAVNRTKRQKSLPARAGEPWEKSESETLAGKFDEGVSITELAKQHERTRGAIQSQLTKLGKIIVH